MKTLEKIKISNEESITYDMEENLPQTIFSLQVRKAQPGFPQCDLLVNRKAQQLLMNPEIPSTSPTHLRHAHLDLQTFAINHNMNPRLWALTQTL
jgi:hypothetical protein